MELLPSKGIFVSLQFIFILLKIIKIKIHIYLGSEMVQWFQNSCHLDNANLKT